MATNRYHDYLQRVPLFASLDRKELDEVANATTDLDLSAGTVVLREGHTGRELIIVVEGTLAVSRDGEHIADIGPGGFAGELALIGHTQRNSTVAAATEASVIHIDGRAFDNLIERVPQIAARMLPIIAARATVAEPDDHSTG